MTSSWLFSISVDDKHDVNLGGRNFLDDADVDDRFGVSDVLENWPRNVASNSSDLGLRNKKSSS